MQRLRVLTLNIWAHNGPWPARAAAIRAGLVAEQADVVALQEVLGFPGSTTQLDELCALLPAELYPHRAYGPACVLPDQRTFGNALLSRFPLIKQHSISLPNPRRREPRALLCCLIALPAAQLPVFTTHLDWELDGSYARCQQVRFIAEQIEQEVAAARRRPGADVLPPLLLGDFNAEPESDELRFLSGHHALPSSDDPVPRGVYFNDCYVRALTPEAPSREDATGTPGATFVRRNPFAARAHEPDRRLDYIFVGLPDAGGRGEPLRAWRCFCAPHKTGGFTGSHSHSHAGLARPAGSEPSGVHASDHFGVAVDLAI